MENLDSKDKQLSTIDEIKSIEPYEESSFIKVNSSGLLGINAYKVEIEIQISNGLPNFILVGLPDTAVNESKERVKSALKAFGINANNKKIVANLAPADTKKGGPNYDLPIAIGILSQMNNDFNEEIINSRNLENIYIVGELGLSGKVRRINGVLSHVINAKEEKSKAIIIPYENKDEASLISGVDIYPVKTLKDTIDVINNIKNTPPLERSPIITSNNKSLLDLSDVKGQALGKRALEIAASGSHHLLLIGSPGSGKSMLAQRIQTILPDLTEDELIEVIKIYSTVGKVTKDISLTRPFRSPHHNTSVAGLIGGSTIPRPGEISLAHKGILFLDEFTEFPRSVLENLRQSLETKEITISRSRNSISYPCDFILIAACNPCPCGYMGDKERKCNCSEKQIKKYISKLSGPILDRIDLQVKVKRLTEDELLNKNNSQTKTSMKIKDKIINCKKLQKERFKDLPFKTNSTIPAREMNSYCKLDSSSLRLMKDAIKKHSLTGRSYDRVLKVSRTIADLNESPEIKEEHLLEALQFRMQTL